MELEIVRREKRELHLKVIGEDATLCNLLVKTLHTLPEVEFASFRQEHPLLSPFEIFVRVKEGKVEAALYKAAKKVSSECESLLRKIKNSGK